MTNARNGATVSAQRAQQLVDQGALLLDVRRTETRQTAGTVPGALTVEKTDVDTLFAPGSDLHARAQGRAVVVFCTSEGGSGPIVDKLLAWGYPAVFQISGGYPAWKAAGHSVAGVDRNADVAL
ncbi:rhodanese-like domain-containing protein [Mycobacterium sp. BMJ-28]